MSRPRHVEAQEATVEKRRYERAPVVVRVDYSTVDDFFSEFTRDINEGGLFVRSDRPHPPDTVVSLQFELPGGGEPVHVSGRVVWVAEGDAPGMGIEFEDLDSGSRARINQLVRRLRAAVPHPS